MKTKIKLPGAALALALLSSLNIQLSNALAQGSLTPPGPPGASMLTLSQVEPRTPISSVPFTISSPGSYYLTTNVTTAVSNAITIAVSGVSLDLSGFTIGSTVADPATEGTAILLNGGLSDITICNGHIRGGVTNNGSGVYTGTGFGYGIYYSGTPPANVLVSHVSVSGCLYFGIALNTGDSTVVESCAVRTVGSIGISASTVKQSRANDCGSIGIYGEQVSDCRGDSTGDAGIYASVAENCYGFSSAYIGISAQTVQNCYGYSTANVGIYTTTSQNSSGYSSSLYGIEAYTVLNCYGDSGSYTGIYADNIENSYGYSGGGNYGIDATYIANGCFGYSYSGTGLYAFIANVCHGATSSGTPMSVTHNINSF